MVFVSRCGLVWGSREGSRLLTPYGISSFALPVRCSAVQLGREVNDGDELGGFDLLIGMWNGGWRTVKRVRADGDWAGLGIGPVLGTTSQPFTPPPPISPFLLPSTVLLMISLPRAFACPLGNPRLADPSTRPGSPLLLLTKWTVALGHDIGGEEGGG